MQRIIVLLLFLLFTVNAMAQDFYYVTVVRGTVKKADKTLLKTGDKLEGNTRLLFADKTCRLLLLHPKKGRFVIEATEQKAQVGSEFFLYVKDNIHLQTESIRLSSRGDIGVDEFFTTRNTDGYRLLFIGNTKFDLNGSGYSGADNNNNFFFLQYTDSNGKLYNTKLLVAHDSLHINESSFLFNGEAPDSERDIKIGYIKQYNSSNREIKQIGTFRPVFLSDSACKQLLLTVKQIVGSNKEKVIEETYLELLSLYGKPYIETLNTLYDQL